jgi:hypothetical protein
VITVKVWQLMVIGLGVVVAAFALLTMGHKGTTTPPAAAATPQEQAEAQQIVNVTPTIQAYFAKHHSYARLKLAPATGVSVASATATTYCVESTGLMPHVFKNGPTGALMTGSCAQPAAGVPYTG